jgi:hypothetical protein
MLLDGASRAACPEAYDHAVNEPPPPRAEVADEDADDRASGNGEGATDAPHVIRGTFTFGTPPDAPGASVVPGRTRQFEWRWEHSAGEPNEPGEPHVTDPATYYEALTGKPDPRRAAFISVRRALGLALWVVALAIPTVLVVLAISSGQSLETIVFMGAAGLLVGLLIRSSAPKTPFD